ncbi:class I SAM-dependent methyltransferase [Streptomyces sp. NBC_01236]|uniref:class I SAM-dependent methyltransferase n=1 Tax=Streptomyces sp. NBC_01236 TaxID=2903789 RepID=UPI002E16405B|nr:methyltransferase domain-containing protein [Streptomyces sp. NBC_01236]
MSGTSGYAFDNTSELAGGRFDALETCYDPVTFARLADLGVGPGMRCLELGGGGGSVAGWLADRVGPTGSVLVTDLEPRWMDGLPGRANLRVVRHDIGAEELPEGDFDLIHARLVLLHVPERGAALDRLVRALRPGGLLVLDEFDCGWIPVLASPSPESAALFERMHDAVMGIITAAGADMRWGVHAYAALCRAGLTEVASATYAESWRGGSSGTRLHQVNIRQLAGRLVEKGLTQEQLDDCMRLLDDPDFAVNSYPLITTWGVRP